MSSRRRKSKAVPFSAAEVANIAKSNPYIQRLIEDASLRNNVQKAIESSKSAYVRLSNGKSPHRAVLEDKKLQNDMRQAFEAVRDASLALTESPRKQARKGRRFETWEEVCQAVQEATAYWNRHRHPFLWGHRRRHRPRRRPGIALVPKAA